MDGHGDPQEERRQRVPFLDLQKLRIISPLGRGAKGVVFLVESEDGKILALKAILRALIHQKNKKSGRETSEYRRICFERDVLASFEHPLLPKLHGLLSTDKLIGYAIDYCPGRDLNSLRKNQTEKVFSDDIIRFYAAEMVLALEYLHGLGIVYRDLKPENVMIQENGHLMLVDFDLSTRLSPKTPVTRQNAISRQNSESTKRKKSILPLFVACCNPIASRKELVHPYETDSASTSDESDLVEKSNSFVGTEEYVAPEIISGSGHDFSVDWWCLGVMLHEMLYGTTPFRGINRKETFYRVLTKNPELVGEPTPLRDLIRKLLEKDPRNRISAKEIKAHDFFKSVDWDRILDVPRPPFIPAPEENGGNEKQIDVESFVKGVFGIGDDVDDENFENKKHSGETSKGVWVEGLNNSNNLYEEFLFF